MDHKIFYEYVAQELTDYANGEGDKAHDVLARIQWALEHVDTPTRWSPNLETRGE